MRSSSRRWIRIGVSAGILAVLFRFIPVRDLLNALGRIPRSTVLVGILVVMVGHVASALKWRMLQGGRSTGLSVRGALSAHFYGVMANLWLPGLAGGDLVRAGLIARQSDRPALVAVASLVDRLADTVALVALAASGVFLTGAPTRTAERVLMVGAGALVAIGLALAVGYRWLRARPRQPFLTALADATQLIAQRPGRVVVAVATSLAIQTAFLFINISFGRALGMAAPMSAWFMAWPLAKVAALIPISAAGIGVREAALVMLLRPYGDPSSIVMAAGLLWQGMLVAVGVIGCLVFSTIPTALAARVPALGTVALDGAATVKE